MQEAAINVRPGRKDGDKAWIESLSVATWGSDQILVYRAGRPELARAGQLPALIAWRGRERVGWLAYRDHGESRELVSLVAVETFRGVGTALLASLAEDCREAGARRIWLVTSNDNLVALRFYQRRGFRLTALYDRALEQARSLKPSLPRLGQHGIPVRDMLEMEALPEELLAAPPAGDEDD